jgi:hypothetical protein
VQHNLIKSKGKSKRIYITGIWRVIGGGQGDVVGVRNGKS